MRLRLLNSVTPSYSGCQPAAATARPERKKPRRARATTETLPRPTRKPPRQRNHDERELSSHDWRAPTRTQAKWSRERTNADAATNTHQTTPPFVLSPLTLPITVAFAHTRFQALPLRRSSPYSARCCCPHALYNPRRPRPWPPAGGKTKLLLYNLISSSAISISSHSRSARASTRSWFSSS